MRRYLSPLLARALAAIGAPADTEIILDYPRRKDLGDLSTGLAHRLSTAIGRPAPEIASEIVAVLERDPRFLSVDIAPNGFINFRFLPPFFHMRLEEMPPLSSTDRSMPVLRGDGAFTGDALQYIQYTHFRIAGIIRHATSEGFPLNRHASPEPLTHPREIDLIRSLLPFPDAVERATSEENPGIIAAYLRELAESVNAFHATHRIIGEPEPVRDARLRLLDAAGMTLRRGLEMIGMPVMDRV
ncbi:MAG: DALR anticodon-binding domain-containing protein [Candidatus Kapaibacterium sp.]